MTTTEIDNVRSPKAVRECTAPGEILPGAIYTLSEFCARMGIGDHVLRWLLRKSGMRIIRVKKKRFILGADWIQFAISETEKSKGKEALYGCCKPKQDD